VPVDRLTGYRAGPLCPADRIVIDYFVQGTEPTQECDGALIGPVATDSTFLLPGAGQVTVPVAPKAGRKSAADSVNPFRLP
jgi:hypothetical protein